MDDEIDIEEHDVLEDPRLRNIFPDISQIKIEIPDDLEDESMDYELYSVTEENSNHQETDESAEYTRQGNKIILGSKPNPTASKVSENANNGNGLVFGTKGVKQEYLHVGDTPDTTIEDKDKYNQSSSVIIIGSKPCKAAVIGPISVKDTCNNVCEDLIIDTPLDIEAENNNEDSHVIKDSVVLLENWGPILQNSSCFCKDCEILFPTTNTLHAHNNIAHSLLVVVDKNKAVKSTAKKQDVTSGKFCNHCNKMFPNSDSLINHLYENMTVNKNTQVKSTASTSKANLKLNPFNKTFEALTPEKTVPTPRIIENKPQPQIPGSMTTYSYKYKCVVCSEIFLNYTKARYHRTSKHPELSGHNILKKITYTSKIPSVANKTNHIPYGAPKNTVTISSKQPPLNSPKPSPTKSSEISPSKAAEGQLTISQALVPVSVLFKCDKCDIHFTSCYPANQHAKSCPQKPGEWTCEICQLQFKSWGRVMHKLQHKYSEKFSVYTCTENIEGRVLNHCPDCNTYLHEKVFSMHRSIGQPCKKIFINCNLCSLPIHSSSANEHKRWHATIKMGDKEIILVEFMKTDEVKVATGPIKRKLQMDDTPVAEPKKAKIEALENKPKKMLVLYCKTCNSFLFSWRHKYLHLAGRCKSIKYSRIVCKICGLVCQQNHMYQKVCQRVKGNLFDMKFVTIKDNKVICPPMPQYPKCKKCQVHFCSTKSVTSHDCKESHKTCKYCKEKFSDLAHTLHVRFHLLHLNINAPYVEKVKLSKAIKVNVPNIKGPKKSLMPDLLKKYQMLTNGLHILYLCETCDIACDSYDRAIEHCQKHYNNMESYDVIVNPCEICGLKFDSTCYDGHMTLHDQNRNLVRDSFHVIKYEYNYLFHKDWNNILSDLPAAQAQQILASSIYRYGKSFKLKIVRVGPPEATLYKCEKCKTFVHPTSLTFHYRTLACDKATCKQKCRHCGRPMSTVSTRAYHEKLHRTHSKFQIVHFNEEGDEEFNRNLREHETRNMSFSNLPKNGVFNMFMCEKCQCCVVARKDHRCPKTIHQRMRCAKCQLYFSYRHITKHMKIHEMNPSLCRKYIKLTYFKPTKNPNINNTSYRSPRLLELGLTTSTSAKDFDLYKCGCGLHFTTSKAAEKHLGLCKTDTGNTSTEKCSKCGLLFDTAQLVTHLCKHHSNGSNKSTKFKIAPLEKHCKVHVNGFVLLKCVKCNVHFTSNSSMRRHFSENHIMKKVVTCPHCKLAFRPYALLKHIRKHHKTQNVNKKDDLRSQSRVAKPSLKLKPGTRIKLLKKLQRSGNELKKSYGKVLYQCKYCKRQTLFLGLKALYSHYARKLHDRATAQCEECNYSFLQKGISLDVHKYVHHKLRKFKREDFIIKVPQRHKLAAIATSEETSQNSTEVDEPEPIRTGTLTEKPKYRSLARKSTTKSIVTKLNTSKTTVNKSPEETCSTSDNTAANQDTVNDGKRKYKLFNVLFKCDICECHFCTGQQVVNHINDIHVKSVASANVELCLCGLTFNKFMLSRHQQIHHEKQDLTAADFYIIPVNRYKDIVGHKHLFRCSVCKLNHMKLARLEEHMNNVEHYLGKSRCPKCHLAFLPGVLSNHITLHHDVLDMSINEYVIMESVGEDSVSIVGEMDPATTQNEESSFADTRQKTDRFPKKGSNKRNNLELKSIDAYDYTKLYNENSDVESIEKKIRELAETSITEAATEYLTHLKGAKVTCEPSAKGKINLMHLYKEKLYKCSSCDTNFVHSRSLEKHTRKKNACPTNNVVCLICNLKIAEKAVIIHVKFQHQMLKLARDDFIVIDSHQNVKDDSSVAYDTCESFDDESVIESEKDNISILSKEDSVSTVSKDDSNRRGALYRCATCSCNFLSYKSREHHYKVYCNDDLITYKCSICQLPFTKISLTKHLRRDHLGVILAKNFESQPQSTLDESYAEDSPSTSQTNLKRVNPFSRGMTQSKCLETSKSPEEFLSFLNLPRHFYSEIKTERYNNELYKCKFCPLHFFTALALKRHLVCYNYREHPGCDVVTCKFCEKEFTNKVLAKHIYTHHVKLKISKNGYQIIDSIGEHIETGISSKEIVDEPIDEVSTEDKISRDDCSIISILDDEVFENTEEPKEIADKISTLNTDLYSNKLFKCNVCDLHFLTNKSWHWHIKNAQHGAQKTHCTFCGLAFNVKTLPTHVFIHHDKLNLMKEHFLINCSVNGEVVETDEEPEETVADVTATPRNDINTNNKNNVNSVNSKVAPTITNNIEINTENVVPIHKTDIDECEVLEPADTPIPSSKDVVSASLQETSSPNLDSSSPESKTSSEKNNKIIKLYKCGDCNVCFLNQTSCYKHVTKHTPLDGKDYIECKLCGYQFMIVNSLHKHIWKHHNRVFKPEEVLIEEYHPNILCHGSPKIEIYFGSDKVQSKLVSTTTAGNVSLEIDKQDVDMTENTVEGNRIDTSENTRRVEDIVNELNVESMDIDLTNASITIDE